MFYNFHCILDFVVYCLKSNNPHGAKEITIGEPLYNPASTKKKSALTGNLFKRGKTLGSKVLNALPHCHHDGEKIELWQAERRRALSRECNLDTVAAWPL